MYFDDKSASFFALYKESVFTESLTEAFAVVEKLLLLDAGLESDILSNFGLNFSSLFSFCCFQLGVFQLGVFSSTFSTLLGVVEAACFFQEGTGLSGVDGVELSGVVLTDAFHDGDD